MTTDQYVLLSVLVQGGEATQQELVTRCHSDTATIGTMLTLLESKGLITRRPHPQDGRARNVELTRLGRKLAEQMRRGSASIRSELAALFSGQEFDILVEFLERLAGAMRPARRDRSTSHVTKELSQSERHKPKTKNQTQL